MADFDSPWKVALDKYNREVASFAVLGDEDPDWRPRRFGYSRWGVEVDFRFPIVKLLDYADKRAELESSDNPFAAVVLAHLDTQETCHDQTERKDRKFRLIRRLMERGWSEELVRRLFRLIDWLMELPQPLADQFWKQLTQYKEEKQMPFITTPERYGRAKGLAEGRAEGRLNGIESVLRVRFPDAVNELMPEIRQIRDPEQLVAILHAAETIADPGELRKFWTNEPVR